MTSEERYHTIANDLEASVAEFFDLLTLKAAAPQPHGDDGGRQSRDSREESKRSVSAFVQRVQEALSYVDDLAAQLPAVQLREEVQQLREEITKKDELIADAKEQIAQWRASHKSLQGRYQAVTSLKLEPDTS